MLTSQIQYKMRCFQWKGQPTAEWPRWLIFQNYASDATCIRIHTLLSGLLTARLGDCICIDPQNEVSIKASI